MNLYYGTKIVFGKEVDDDFLQKRCEGKQCNASIFRDFTCCGDGLCREFCSCNYCHKRA